MPPPSNPLAEAVLEIIEANIPKAPFRSRVVWALGLLLAAVLARALVLLGLLPPALAEAANAAWASEQLAVLIVVIAAGGLAVEVRGRVKARAEIERTVAKRRRASPRSSERGSVAVELLAQSVLLVLGVLGCAAVLGLLGGCSPQAVQLKRCDLVLRDHPTKPAPAAAVEVDCGGVRLRWEADELVTIDHGTRRCDDGPALP